MASKRTLGLALILTCATAAKSAWSDTPTPEERETARAMMDDAHTRRDAGDHDGALRLFLGADAIMHVPTTGLEVAREQVSIARLVEARDLLQRVIHTPATTDEPEAFRSARLDAMALDDDLVKRIPALRISVGGVVAGARVQLTVDGVSLPLAALVAPFRLNPGHHVVTLTTDRGTLRREVDLSEKQTVPVSLVIDEAPTFPVVPSVAVLPAQGAPTSSVVSWLRWGGLSLAVVGAGVGAVAGVMSLSSTNAASKMCVDHQCPPSTWNDIDQARTTATLSTIAFSAAGVGVVLALASLWVHDGTPHAAPEALPGPTARRGATLWLDATGGGIRGAF